MEACRRELSFEPRDLTLTPVAVAERIGKAIGVAQVKVFGGEADLLKLFVEPSALRSGVGKALLVWATDVAKKLSGTQLTARTGPWRPCFPVEGDHRFRWMTTTCSGRWRPGQQGCGRA
jgi:GNAT superfamily N-acetyltransferase